MSLKELIKKLQDQLLIEDKEVIFWTSEGSYSIEDVTSVEFSNGTAVELSGEFLG